MAEENKDVDGTKLPKGFTDVMWVIFDLCYFTCVRVNPKDVVLSEA